MCNAFFLLTPLISDESRKPDVASSKRLYNEEEEACNNKSHRLIEKQERRCVGEERTVLCPPWYVE